VDWNFFFYTVQKSALIFFLYLAVSNTQIFTLFLAYTY